MPSVSFRGRFTRHKRHNMAVEYITLRDERKALAVRMWQVSSDTFLGVGSAESNVTWDVLRFMKCVINSDHTHGEKYANAAQIAGWGALAIPREGGITFCRSFSRCLRMWFFCQPWARGNLFDFIDLLNQQIIFQQLNMAPILCIFFHVLIHTGCWSSDFSCTAKHLPRPLAADECDAKWGWEVNQRPSFGLTCLTESSRESRRANACVGRHACAAAPAPLFTESWEDGRKKEEQKKIA